ATRLEFSSPILQRGESHQDDEQRPERDHDVKRVVKKLDVVRPRISRKVVQSVDKTSKMSVSEKTECAGRFDRIVESLSCDIRLANERHPRHLSALEFPFHRSERDRLMMTDHLGLCVAGWKGNEEGRDQTNERSRAQIKFRLDRMNAAQRVERSDRGDNERAGHDRGQLIMRELHERPRI